MKKIWMSLILLALPCCAVPRAPAPSAPANPRSGVIETFDQCVAAGFEIIRSQPLRCVTPEGLVLFKNTASRNDRGGLCKDMCGDGVCQQIVCMGENCPCAETPVTCPGDCVAGF